MAIAFPIRKRRPARSTASTPSSRSRTRPPRRSRSNSCATASCRTRAWTSRSRVRRSPSASTCRMPATRCRPGIAISPPRPRPEASARPSRTCCAPRSGASINCARLRLLAERAGGRAVHFERDARRLGHRRPQLLLHPDLVVPADRTDSVHRGARRQLRHGAAGQDRQGHPRGAH